MCVGGERDKLSLFPLTAIVDSEGHLCIGGCDVVELAAEFGTPLYLFDEVTLRHKCAEFKEEFAARYRNTRVIYACKAFTCTALVAIFREEGLGLDVVSGGELSIAQSVGFPSESIYFHGNNKSAAELRLALEWNVGRIVVDNFHELDLLNVLAREADLVQDILLRVSPGVDPHTHHYTTTGVLDSKFGFPIVTGQAETALVQAMSASHLNLLGLHFHLGSPIFEVGPYQEAIKVVLRFAAEMKERHGFKLREFSPGGGFAIPYTLDTPTPTTADFAEAIGTTLLTISQELGIALPQLIIEPGRAIVGQAGVALYTAGGSKDIPGVCKYVFVDGGIGDNIRPALYGAKYEALVANKALVPETERVTIAGKYCESGDILIRDVDLAPISAGDLIALPVCGAYCLAMASNYNASLKPPIVMVNEGGARLIRRRETYQDLVKGDLISGENTGVANTRISGGGSLTRAQP